MSRSKSNHRRERFLTLQSILSGPRSAGTAKKRWGSRPCIERLEDRTVLSLSFSAPMNYTLSRQPNDVVVGDFNGDGKPDLLHSDNKSTVGLLLGNGDGTFQAAQDMPIFDGEGPMAVGDFNGDGKLDLAILDTGGVNVLLGNGDGTFQADTRYYFGGVSPQAIAVGDLRGDGKLDIVTANTVAGTISVLLGNGDGTFQAPETLNVGGRPLAVALGDFNNDHKLDIVAADYQNSRIDFLPGQGDGTFPVFEGIPTNTGSENFSAHFQIAVGDFNGDGNLDLATVNYASGLVSVLLGHGNGTFGTHNDYTVGTNPVSVVVGDFDGDGKLDLATVNFGSNDVSILLGNGDGTFQNQQRFPVGGKFPQGLAIGDFDGNGKLDLVIANQNSNLGVLLNQSTGTAPPVVTPPANQTAIEGTASSLNLGSFSDAGSGSWTASVSWGDGMSSPLPAPSGPGSLGSSSHLYAEEGTYTVTVTVTDTGTNQTGSGMYQVTVSDSNVIGMPANVSPTAGAPFSGAVATFIDPGGAEANDGTHYSASINWGDNTAPTIGTIALANAIFTISGTHTYAAANSYPIMVTINHEGETPFVQETATVTSLGQIVPAGLSRPISFWAGLQGQELLRRFGLTVSGQSLGQWLATAFPNLYGGQNGAPNLSPFTNAQISSYYQSLFLVSKGVGLDAEVLATALEVFTTTLSLGGTTGQANGFTVNSNGLGAYSWNIGASGQAFGVSNNTVLDVYQILLAANNSAAGGEPWGSNTLFRNEAFAVFHGVNGG